MIVIRYLLREMNFGRQSRLPELGEMLRWFSSDLATKFSIYIIIVS